MIGNFVKTKKYFFWTLFHLILGWASLYSKFIVIFYVYGVLLFSFTSFFDTSNKNSGFNYLIVYLISFELLARMVKATPFLPYEWGKYFLFLSLILGILKSNLKYNLGFILFLLLVPSIFLDYSGSVHFKNLIFNALGPINLALAVWYFQGQWFTPEGFRRLLLLIMWPLTSSLAYSIFRIPDLEKIEFSLVAMSSTTGGFGSNQVSSAFGLAIVIGFYLWITNSQNISRNYLFLALMLLFTIQGLLSFSRGGMLGGALGILVILYYFSRSGIYTMEYLQFKRSKKYILPAVLLFFLTFQIANALTDGLLTLRYKGETAGTLAGSKEKSVNTLTSNRYDIFFGDLKLFREYPITGVGVGASPYLRDTVRGVAPHVELSRLLAEHGILGLIFAWIVFIILFRKIMKSPVSPNYKAILMALYVVGIFTSFHNATRTFITPLMVGLSMVNIMLPQTVQASDQVSENIKKSLEPHLQSKLSSIPQNF